MELWKEKICISFMLCLNTLVVQCSPLIKISKNLKKNYCYNQSAQYIWSAIKKGCPTSLSHLTQIFHLRWKIEIAEHTVWETTPLFITFNDSLKRLVPVYFPTAVCTALRFCAYTVHTRRPCEHFSSIILLHQARHSWAVMKTQTSF